MSNPLARKIPFGGMVLFQRITVTNGPVTTIDFLTIPQTSGDLFLTFQGRDTAAGSTALAMPLRINGDNNSASYTSAQELFGAGSSAGAALTASSANGSPILLIPGVQNNANAVGGGTIVIPNYTGRNFYKIVRGNSMALYSTSTLQTDQFGFMYLPANPVNRLTFTAPGTAFAVGSYAALYGIGG